MPMTDKKIYMIDDEPVSPKELIEQAEALDEAFSNDWLKQVSVAANILRDSGYSVTKNPEYSG